MQTEPYESDADTEKMSAESDSNSALSVPLPPIETTQLDIEKTTSRNTQGSRRADAELSRTITSAYDWNGPDDPEDPLNWSTGKKIYHTVVPGLQAFVVTFGSSVYTPSVPEVSKHFGVSLTAALLPLTVYVIGLGFGPMISAPISETFGRRAVYLFFFVPSLLFTMGAGFSNTFAGLVICRFLAGTVGSGTLAVGAGSNSDLWAPIHRAIASSIFLMAPFLGPAIGPALGGYVAMNKDWRWTQWLTLFWGVLAYAFTIPQKETYKRIILEKRAKTLGVQGPPSLVPPGMNKMHFIIVVTVARPLRMLFTESIVGFFSIYTAFNFSVLFGFFAAFPIVFRSPYPEIQIYHFNTGEAGLVFLGIGIGVVLGCVISVVIDRMIYRKKTLKRQAQGDFHPLQPEERLYAAMLGSFLLPVGLFWFAWTSRSDIHWIVPVLGTIPFGIGNFLVFCSCVLYLIDTYGPLSGASAAAANGLLRYLFGAVFPLFTVQMYVHGFIPIPSSPPPLLILLPAPPYSNHQSFYLLPN